MNKRSKESVNQEEVNLIATEFSLANLRNYVRSVNKSYFQKMVEQIAQRITKKAIAEEDSVWVTFLWEDGNYDEIIKFFEDRGITVGSPTQPWEGGATSFLFSWNLDNPMLEQTEKSSPS